MKLLGQILFPLLILALGFLGFKALAGSKQPLKSKAKPVIIPQVEVIEVRPGTHAPPVISFGTVQSYFETTLTSQVTGEIQEVSPSFRAGIMVKQGELLTRVDDSDFQAALATATAETTTSARLLAEERILAQQSSEDWVASGRALEDASDFVLRKPQLEAARANLASAQAMEKKAQIDIRRTVIRAPYEAMVLERNASVGNLATPQQPLGRLVATERAEVRLPLTGPQLARLDLAGLSASSSSTPSKTLRVSLHNPSQPDSEWPAKIVRLEALVDAANQVSYAIAEVEKPYTGHAQVLPIGTFVNVSIEATRLAHACALRESAFVNDRFIWVVDADNQLQQLSAKRLHSHEGQVYLDIDNPQQARDGEALKVVTRPLSNFKKGMKVRTVSGELSSETES